MFVHFFQIIKKLYVWSVCYLAYFLIEIRPIYKYLQYCMIYLSEIFGDITRTFLDYFQIIQICQSASWLTSLLKLGSYRDISSSVGDISLKFFRGIPGMFVHLSQIILKFLYVCQSAIWLTSLNKLHKLR